MLLRNLSLLSFVTIVSIVEPNITSRFTVLILEVVSSTPAPRTLFYEQTMSVCLKPLRAFCYETMRYFGDRLLPASASAALMHKHCKQSVKNYIWVGAGPITRTLHCLLFGHSV